MVLDCIGVAVVVLDEELLVCTIGLEVCVVVIIALEIGPRLCVDEVAEAAIKELVSLLCFAVLVSTEKSSTAFLGRISVLLDCVGVDLVAIVESSTDLFGLLPTDLVCDA
jgi:hypothetical protein